MKEVDRVGIEPTSPDVEPNVVTMTAAHLQIKALSVTALRAFLFCIRILVPALQEIFHQKKHCSIISRLDSAPDFTYINSSGGGGGTEESTETGDIFIVPEQTQPIQQQPTPPAPQLATGKNMQSITIPYKAGGIATLMAEFPMASQEWDQMMAVLTAMKPALAKEKDAEQSS